MASTSTLFAEVVIDTRVPNLASQVFTYRVPEYLAKEAFVGASVLVPFGKQEAVSGYVVAIKNEVNGNFKVKDVLEVTDKEPLFDANYVDFLYWISNYYCASISSTIAAAIPSSFGVRLRRVVKLLAKVNIELSDHNAKQIMKVLLNSKTGTSSLLNLRRKSKLSARDFYKAMLYLKEEKFVEIQTETKAASVPKLISIAVWTGAESKKPRHAQIIAQLKQAGGQMPIARLIESARTTHATLKRLNDQGVVLLKEEEILRDPLERIGQISDWQDKKLLNLTDDQLKAYTLLSAELEKVLHNHKNNGHDLKEVEPYLLHGVTGSGKTEIYLRLIQKCLDQNRSALLLVPEISLTPQLALRLKTRFGRHVAVWHSALSDGERYDTWRRMKAGDVQVLLGARSAILTSMPNLGLIILDEEHDGSYKQSNPNPRYHAKNLALEKAKRQGAMVLLGSATPDISSYYQAKNTNKLLNLPERVFKQVMPEICMVDMRNELEAGNRTIFSRLLSTSLKECLDNNEQAILLMNRRGYANYVFCRACGYVMKCKNCSVSLVFHQPHKQSKGQFSCHHCGYFASATHICPSCESPFLKEYGLGTQKVEEEIKTGFPQARVLRLDSDIASKKGAYESVFNTFAEGKADILIGTQMVAKGIDIPQVTLVGVLTADSAFNLPDYRSAERGFQLLTQAAGRAGRGQKIGKVVMQTYNTELPALNLVKNHEYIKFVEEEIAARKELKYPPFCQIIRIVIASRQATEAESCCEKLTEELIQFLEDKIDEEALKIFGPAPCLIEKLANNWRFHVIIKNFAGDFGKGLVTSFLEQKHLKEGLTMAIDVDALDLL